MDGQRKKKVLSTYLAQDKVSFKQSLAEQGIDLWLRSFICIEPIDVNLPKADWYFVQSPKTAQLLACYPDKLALLKGAKVAAIGPSTEKALNQAGIAANFIGKGISTEVDILSFLNVVADTEQVCVLSGDKSLNRLKAVWPNNKLLTHILYRNKALNNRLMEGFNWYHFTSPSQVEAYLGNNNLEMDSQIIAMGKSTETCLNTHGFKSILPNDYRSNSVKDIIVKQLT